MGRIGHRVAIGSAIAAAFVAGYLTANLVSGPDRGPTPPVASTPAAPAPGKPAIGPDRTRPDSPPIDLGDSRDCGLGGTCLDEKHLLIPLRG